MNDVDDRLSEALDAASRNVVSDEAIAARIIARAQHSPSSSPRSRVKVTRVVALVTATLVASTTVALGANGTLHRWFGDDPATPANRIEVLQSTSHPFNMAVFDDRNIDYEDPESALAVWLSVSASMQEEGRHGTAVEDAAQTLLETPTTHGLGTVRIAAVPTTSGNVCIAFHTAEPSGTTCIEKLDDAEPVSAQYVGAGKATAVLGLRLDNVERVSVRTENGTTEPATLGANAYVWSGTVDNNAVNVLAHLTDGRTVELPVPGAKDFNDQPG